MSNGQYRSDFHLNFPTEKMREDFEIAFQAFVKDFQKQQTIYYSLRSGQVAQQGGGQQGGGQQGGGQGRPHVFGTPGGGQQQGGGQGPGQGQGLIRVAGSDWSVYVDFF